MPLRDFVIIASQRWDFEIGSNARNIALEISKKYRVVYVNPPEDLISLIKKFGKRLKKSRVTKEKENLWVLAPHSVVASINWINSKLIYEKLNFLNNKKFARNISNELQQLGIMEFVILNDNYMFNGLYLKELLRPVHYLYYIRDYLTIQTYFKRHGELVEPELMKKADAVVANSTYLKEYAERYNTKSYYVGQGCEVEMFDDELVKEIPSDLQRILKPIVGYVGFLTAMRLDIDLLILFAKQKPNLSLVLVGPEDEAFKRSELHQLSNVYFLGRRDPDQLPGYIKGFDVCINPQVINQLTVGNYPRKVDEYLAMGKPTVATATKAMEVFREYTYLASNSEQFLGLVEKALHDKNEELKEKRIAFARSHTWKNSVGEIYSVIDELDKKSN